MRAYPYMPGVPAAGHVTSGGYWHPGKIDGCVKCGPDTSDAGRTRGCKVNKVPASQLHEGDVIHENDWDLHVTHVDSDTGGDVAYATREFGFPLHAKPGEMLTIVERA